MDAVGTFQWFIKNVELGPAKKGGRCKPFSYSVINGKSRHRDHKDNETKKVADFRGERGGGGEERSTVRINFFLQFSSTVMDEEASESGG